MKCVESLIVVAGVMWLATANAGEGPNTFAMEARIIQSSADVGAAAATLHLVLTNTSADAVETTKLAVSAIGATLGAASMRIDTSNAPVTRGGEWYYLMRIGAGQTAHVDVALQGLAPSGQIQATAINANAAADLSQPLSVDFATQLPDLALKLASANKTPLVGDLVSFTATVSQPENALAFAKTLLRLESSGLTVKSVGMLEATPEGYILSALDPQTPLVLTISAQVNGLAASLTARITEGTATGEMRKVTLQATSPLLKLISSFDGQTRRVGDDAIVTFKLTAPDVALVFTGLSLRVEVEGIEVVGATLDGKEVSANGERYVLPDFSSGASKTLVLRASITQAEAFAEAIALDAQGQPISASASSTLSSTASAAPPEEKLAFSAGCSAAPSPLALLLMPLVFLWRKRSRR